MYGNTITLVGNLTRDPKLRFTPSGLAVVKFGLAINNNYTDRNGAKVEESHFYEVEAWRELASNVAESLAKGDRVIVSGQLKYQAWENEAGEKRSKLVVAADSIGPDLRWATAEITHVERAGAWQDEVVTEATV